MPPERITQRPEGYPVATRRNHDCDQKESRLRPGGITQRPEGITIGFLRTALCWCQPTAPYKEVPCVARVVVRTLAIEVGGALPPVIPWTGTVAPNFFYAFLGVFFPLIRSNSPHPKVPSLAKNKQIKHASSPPPPPPDEYTRGLVRFATSLIISMGLIMR